MHKNYRRKIKQDNPYNFWRDHIRKSKQYELKQRTRKRRQRDRMLIRHEEYDKIEKFERPVDWYAID
jgi:hypothetical protein